MWSFKKELVLTADLYSQKNAAKRKQNWADPLPGPQHPSFTNLCNGSANDSKAVCTSENSNLNTANTVATAVTPYL